MAISWFERAALVDAHWRLPAESEEEIYHPGNWALFGMPLADDPVTSKGCVSGGTTAA